MHVLGVRHHGPGSARSVRQALEELVPDVLVIEGAPELDALVGSAGDLDLVPPVAGLVYAVESPRRAAFYPLATFSPEWVALRWAVARGVPVRFADLPAVHTLAPPPEAQQEEQQEDQQEEQQEEQPGKDGAPEGRRVRPVSRPDAIATLARAAGYDDPERWWEDAVEHRSTSSLETFAVIAEAMGEVRADVGPGSDAENDVREAAMRRVLRAVLKDGASRVAFVCGAYHAPAVQLGAWPAASRDAALLKGLPRTKVAATWVPWTADRLSLASGYGAGVTSPGWYQHLFVSWERGEEVSSGWLARVARELRREGLDAAPAGVVEAVRLAGALAAVRGRPSVGLSELGDATQSVLAGGSELPLQLIDRRLVIGEELGRVPDSVPLTPLAQDLARRQRALRLKPSATPTTIVLDLRREGPRERSVLLHRLRLLDVPWGRLADAGGSTGTFKEGWDLRWEPELSVALIEAGLHGTTVPDAASSAVAEAARDAPDLATLGRLVEECLVAELPGALAAVVDALAERTARQYDTLALLETVEPLARTRRYGDVRGADTARVAGVLRTVVTRASVSLRAACASLDDDAAAAMRRAVDGAHRGTTLVGDPELAEPWRRALLLVAADDRVHGSVSGRVNRLLLDAGALAVDEAGRRMARRLSSGAEALAGAAWLDGFLEGDALLLLHDPDLLGLVDEWVGGVPDHVFDDLLPLLRRTFAAFEPAARRQIGSRLRHGRPAPGAGGGSDGDVDLARALPVVLRVAELLGLEPESTAEVHP